MAFTKKSLNVNNKFSLTNLNKKLKQAGHLLEMQHRKNCRALLIQEKANNTILWSYLKPLGSLSSNFK